MTRLAAALTLVFRIGVGLSFAVILAAVTIQVVSRNFLPASPVWTEELTRYALLYLAAFGIGLAFRSGDLVNIDMAIEALPERAGWALRLLVALSTAIMALALIEPALRFTAIGRIQTSPTLGLRMTWSHAAMVVLLAGLALFAALRVAEMLAGRSDGRPLPPEEE
jgi:TRAP-type transport system small permease protein